MLVLTEFKESSYSTCCHLGSRQPLLTAVLSDQSELIYTDEGGLVGNPHPRVMWT